MINKVLPTKIDLDFANVLTVMVCFFTCASPPKVLPKMSANNERGGGLGKDELCML